MPGELIALPSASGEYVNPQGVRVRLAQLDDLRLYADEQMRQIRRVGVPLAPEAGMTVYRPDSLGGVADAAGFAPAGRVVRAENYLRAGQLADGTSSTVLALSKALAAAKKFGAVLDLRGGKWRVDLLGQLQLHSDLVIWLQGGQILGPDKQPSARGVVFQATNADNVRVIGGDVIGFRSIYDAPVPGQAANLGSINGLGRNVRPFVFTGGSRIEFERTRFRDWNAPAVSADGATDVGLHACRFTNNSAYYYDYVEATQPYSGGGPAVNSTEADKGQYHIWTTDRFVVANCVVEGSPGDSSHVKGSTRGVVSANQIVLNKMGGAYYEACSDVAITGNLQWQNGSRGTTVEANSKNITFNGNVVGLSGREGYWGWGVNSGTIMGNVFYQNGQKQVTGLNCNILLAPFVAATTAACDVTVAHNYLETWAGQEHCIRVSSYISTPIIESNILRGPVRSIRADANLSGQGAAIVRNNDGWITENRGATTITGDGATTTFDVPHGLQFSDPADNRMLNVVKVWADLRPRNSAAASAQAFVKRTTQPQGGCTKLDVQFPVAPASGAVLEFDWLAEIR